MSPCVLKCVGGQRGEAVQSVCVDQTGGLAGASRRWGRAATRAYLCSEYRKELGKDMQARGRVVGGREPEVRVRGRKDAGARARPRGGYGAGSGVGAKEGRREEQRLLKRLCESQM